MGEAPNHPNSGEFGYGPYAADVQSYNTELQTGVSLVSIEHARLNLETELKPFGWDFDACRANAHKVWNELLGRIEIESGRPVDHVEFYTNLYRAYLDSATLDRC